MIATATWLFWLSAVMVVYTVAGYGLILLLLARIKPQRPVPPPTGPLAVDFLIAAYNEAPHIVHKITNSLALKNSQGHRLRVLVMSDGSSDGTVELARTVADPRVTVMETPGRVGKLQALNLGLEQVTGDIVVFSDANSLLSKDSLDALTAPFADERIGGVCGCITVEAGTSGSIGQAESLFWRYDQALKTAEDRLGGAVSAQGSIYAIRRALCAPVAPGMADDFVMSVRVVEHGYQLAFAPQAQTTERVTERAGDEVGRRIRSTEMGWRGLMAFAHLMNPLRTGLYGWQLFSHKFLRRLVPLFLLMLLISSLILAGQSVFYVVVATFQVALYAVALAAYLYPPLRRLPLVGKVMFFAMSNVAMALGVVAYYRGTESSAWEPVRDGD